MGTKQLHCTARAHNVNRLAGLKVNTALKATQYMVAHLHLYVYTHVVYSKDRRSESWIWPRFVDEDTDLGGHTRSDDRQPIKKAQRGGTFY